VIVWGKAWDAGGEKVESCLLFEHTPATVHVPITLSFTEVQSSRTAIEGILKGNGSTGRTWYGMYRQDTQVIGYVPSFAPSGIDCYQLLTQLHGN